VLNKDPITVDTKSIEVKIEAEEGFDPRQDIDMQSLKFGASEEVNFGGGCLVKETRKAGKDLVVVFDAKGNGFSSDNFAGKLLGKTVDGKLLFGYSRLPRVDYLEPILSARQPKLIQHQNGGLKLHVEVQNFGQVPSDKTEISIWINEENKKQEIATGIIETLNSFEKITLALTPTKKLDRGKEYDAMVVINPHKKTKTTFNTTINY
jgi:hypothetical protein